MLLGGLFSTTQLSPFLVASAPNCSFLPLDLTFSLTFTHFLSLIPPHFAEAGAATPARSPGVTLHLLLRRVGDANALAALRDGGSGYQLFVAPAMLTRWQPAMVTSAVNPRPYSLVTTRISCAVSVSLSLSFFLRTSRWEMEAR